MTKLFHYLINEIDYSECASQVEVGNAIVWALGEKRMTGIRGLKKIAREFGFSDLEDILYDPPEFVSRSQTLARLHRVITFDYECDGRHRNTEHSARYHYYAADIILAFMQVYADGELGNFLSELRVNNH